MGSTMDEIILNQTLEVVHGVRDLVLCPEVGFDIVEFDDLIGDRYATPLWITDFHYDSVETLVYGLGALIGFAFTMIHCAQRPVSKSWRETISTLHCIPGLLFGRCHR